MKVAIIDPSGFTIPYDHHLCESLAEQGCSVTLISADESEYWQRDRRYRQRTSLYRVTESLFTSDHFERARLAVKGSEHVIDMGRTLAWLSRWDPDVIHVQWLPLPPFDRFLVPLLRRIAPTVMTVHDTKPFHGDSSSRLQLWGANAARRRFDHLVVHTERSVAELTDRGHDRSAVSVIPHGVLRYADEASDEGMDLISPKEREMRVLFFGTIKPYKGVDVLLKALGDLPDPLLDRTELYVAGDPKMAMEPLSKIADASGVADAVRWDLRRVPHKAIPALFRSADVLALPYRNVDQSGVLMSAVGFGTPVVGSNIGGFGEVLTDGEHGRLIPPNDPPALADGLRDVLVDDERRARMRGNLEHLADVTHSWDHISTQTIELYESLTHQKA